ncbi:MAG: acyl carrier protein [Myxococcota bacterium]
MHSDNEIVELFKTSVKEVDNNIKVDAVDITTDITSLGLDSVMTMEVIGVMEEKLNIRFPDEDLATIKKMADLAALVRRLA